MDYKVKTHLVNENCTVLQLEIDNDFRWVHIFSKLNLLKLNLLSQRDEIINGNNIHILAFEHSELRYDNRYGRYVTDDDQFILINHSDEIISSDIDQLIKSNI